MKFSQNEEELYILHYFQGKTGTFLSLGENDGETFSNVRALALIGWRGVMVEPSPKAYERLKNLYNGHKGFYIYPYALAGHNGKAILYESTALCSAEDVGLVSSLDPAATKRWENHRVPTGGRTAFGPIEVKCFRWKTFLNRLPIKEFDFVSIDCEGLDLEILAQMDLSKVQCICLEWNGNLELKKDFEYYLEGFKLLYTSGENVIYGR